MPKSYTTINYYYYHEGPLPEDSICICESGDVAFMCVGVYVYGLLSFVTVYIKLLEVLFVWLKLYIQYVQCIHISVCMCISLQLFQHFL